MEVIPDRVRNVGIHIQGACSRDGRIQKSVILYRLAHSNHLTSGASRLAKTASTLSGFFPRESRGRRLRNAWLFSPWAVGITEAATANFQQSDLPGNIITQ